MKSIGALIFPGFEVLDLFGPLEMFGMLPDVYEIRLVAETLEDVRSGQGPSVVPDDDFTSMRKYDMILVPGGPGTRDEVSNEHCLRWIMQKSESADLVASVCTGAALLACAGLLEGRKATTNKAAWKWATSHGEKTDWEKRARWVCDGRLWTSSGVSAGIDMTLAIIAEQFDLETARQVADWAEYTWQEDPSIDPFAKLYGL